MQSFSGCGEPAHVRRFVHVDYQLRRADDHDPKTPLVKKMQASGRPHNGAGALDEVECASLCRSAAQLYTSS